MAWFKPFSWEEAIINLSQVLLNAIFLWHIFKLVYSVTYVRKVMRTKSEFLKELRTYKSLYNISYAVLIVSILISSLLKPIINELLILFPELTDDDAKLYSEIFMVVNYLFSLVMMLYYLYFLKISTFYVNVLK